MDDIKTCNGERCQKCEYCSKHNIHKLEKDVSAQKWRIGLLVAVGLTFIFSGIADLIMVIKLIGM